MFGLMELGNFVFACFAFLLNWKCEFSPLNPVPPKLPSIKCIHAFLRNWSGLLLGGVWCKGIESGKWNLIPFLSHSYILISFTRIGIE